MSSEPSRLLVGCAGQDWVLEFGDGPTRDEVARWLGPRARELDGDAGPESAGLARFIPCDTLPESAPGAQRRAEGIGFRSRECDVLIRERGGTPCGEIRFRGNTVLEAAKLGLRLLAIRAAFTRGAVALHASSVDTAAGVLVFVGHSGAGKTSARNAFPPGQRLDEDLVLLARRDCSWVRLDLFDARGTDRLGPAARGPRPARPSSPESGGPVIRSVLRPSPGKAFRFVPLARGEALRACLQVPALACVPGDGRAAEEASSVLERLEKLVREVPVARFEWALGDDLPALLEQSLP